MSIRRRTRSISRSKGERGGEEAQARDGAERETRRANCSTSPSRRPRTASTLEAVRQEMEANFEDIYTCFKESEPQGRERAEETRHPQAAQGEDTRHRSKNIKKPVVEVPAIATLTCFAPERAQRHEERMQARSGRRSSIILAPRATRLSLTAPDYKSGEKRLVGIWNI